MTAKELKDELLEMVCPTHGSHPLIKIVNGKPEVYICCCLEFRDILNKYIADNVAELDPLKPKDVKPLTEEQLDEALAVMNQLSLSIEDIQERIQTVSIDDVGAFRSAIKKAQHQIIKLAASKQVETRSIEEWISMILKAKDVLESVMEVYKKREKAWLKAERAALRAKQKEELAKQKALEKERKRQEAAERKTDEKNRKAKLAIIEKNRPIWSKAISEADQFAENYPRTILTAMKKEQIKRVIDLAQKHLIALMPLRQADKDGLLKLDFSLLTEYRKADDKVNSICKVCTGQIDIKTKTATKRKYEKQRENRREDSPYFRKMMRLYDYKLNSSDAWYENESREFSVGRYNEVMEFLEAYGRIIRGSIAKADIVVEGEEDVDKWGYFKLADKYLPFCLREVKVLNDTTVYHLYTFSTQTSMQNYDYDEAITDRIYFLTEKNLIQ